MRVLIAPYPHQFWMLWAQPRFGFWHPENKWHVRLEPFLIRTHFLRASNISSEQLVARWASQGLQVGKAESIPSLLISLPILTSFWTLSELKDCHREPRGLHSRTQVSWTLGLSLTALKEQAVCLLLVPCSWCIAMGWETFQLLGGRDSRNPCNFFCQPHPGCSGAVDMRDGASFSMAWLAKPLLVCKGQKTKGEETPLMELSLQCPASPCFHSWDARRWANPMVSLMGKIACTILSLISLVFSHLSWDNASRTFWNSFGLFFFFYPSCDTKCSVLGQS